MKRWMIVGFAAGAALFGYPPVLVAAAGITEDEDAALTRPRRVTALIP
jgi:hypothetical protein